MFHNDIKFIMGMIIFSICLSKTIYVLYLLGNQTSDNKGIIYIPLKTKFIVSKGYAETIFESARKHLEDIAEVIRSLY